MIAQLFPAFTRLTKHWTQVISTTSNACLSFVKKVNIKAGQLWFILLESASVDKCKDGVSWSSRLEALTALRKSNGDDVLQFPIVGDYFPVSARHLILSGHQSETNKWYLGKYTLMYELSLESLPLE